MTQPQVLPPERLIHLSLGLASPLWPAFYAAAATGLALWSVGAMVRAAGSAAAPKSADLPVAPLALQVIPAPVPIPPSATAAPRPRPARKRPSRARTAAAPAKGTPTA